MKCEVCGEPLSRGLDEPGKCQSCGKSIKLCFDHRRRKVGHCARCPPSTPARSTPRRRSHPRERTSTARLPVSSTVDRATQVTTRVSEDESLQSSAPSEVSDCSEQSSPEVRVRLPLGPDRVRGRLFELYVPTAHGGELRFESTKPIKKLVRVQGETEVDVFQEASRRRLKKSTATIGTARHGAYHLDFDQTADVSCVLVQEGCAKAGEDPAVWNFWYWPFNPTYAKGYGPTQATAALERYTEAMAMGGGKKTQAWNFEQRNHKKGDAQDWEGHCNMATCASVLFKRPTGAKTLRGKTFTVAELKLLAAEYAGNFGKEEDVWLLKTSGEDKNHGGFFSLAYFKPNAESTFKKSTLESLRRARTLPGDDWTGIEKVIRGKSDPDIKALVKKGFGEAARTFYEAVLENLLRGDTPLISNMRGDEGSMGPDEVWNQVFVKFIATFRETPGSGDKKDITIDCLMLSSDDTVNHAAELTFSTARGNPTGLNNELEFHHRWRLQFSNAGRTKQDAKNAWIHVRNTSDENLYSPTDLTKVIKCHKDRKRGADGNIVVGHEIWKEQGPAGAKVRLLEMHEQYEPDP